MSLFGRVFAANAAILTAGALVLAFAPGPLHQHRALIDLGGLVVMLAVNLGACAWPGTVAVVGRFGLAATSPQPGPAEHPVPVRALPCLMTTAASPALSPAAR